MSGVMMVSTLSIELEEFLFILLSSFTLLTQALKLDATEGANIARAFKAKDFSAFMTSGIRAEGQKYQFLRVEAEKVVLGKKKDIGGISMQCSKTGARSWQYVELHSQCFVCNEST